MNRTVLLAFLLCFALFFCQQVDASLSVQTISNTVNEKLNERIIHLPASVFSLFESFDDDNNYVPDGLMALGTYAAIIVIVLSVCLIILPMLVSCGALWLFFCCLYPSASQIPSEPEEEMDERSMINMPKVTLDSGWYTRVQNRLFDVKFVDCAIILFWVVTWLFRKLTCGVFDSIFILRITRFQVRRMVIGNRRLDMDISDACCTIPIIHYLNSFCNFYTCGLWRALGLTHRFYLSKIDKRIYWKPVEEDLDMDRRVVWHNYSNNQPFKWFSIYCGTSTELTYWFLKVLNVSTLFIFGPFIEAWYIRQKVMFAKFGGRGSFAVYNNRSLEGLVVNSPNVLAFISHLDGCSLLIRVWMFRIANVLTLGIFGCIFGESFILSFVDEHLNMLVV